MTQPIQQKYIKKLFLSEHVSEAAYRLPSRTNLCLLNRNPSSL